MNNISQNLNWSPHFISVELQKQESLWVPLSDLAILYVGNDNMEYFIVLYHLWNRLVKRAE